MGLYAKISASIAAGVAIAAAIAALLLLENLGPGREIGLTEKPSEAMAEADGEKADVPDAQRAAGQGTRTKQKIGENSTECSSYENPRYETASRPFEGQPQDDEFKFVKFRIKTPSGEPVIRAKVDVWDGNASDLLLRLPATHTYMQAVESHSTDIDGEFEVRLKRSVLSRVLFTVSSATAGNTFFTIAEFEEGEAFAESEPRSLKKPRARAIRTGDQCLNVLTMGPPVGVNGHVAGQGYDAAAKYTVVAFPGAFNPAKSRRNRAGGVPAIFPSSAVDSAGMWRIRGLDSMQHFTFLVFKQTSSGWSILPWKPEPGLPDDPTVLMRVFEPGNLSVRAVGLNVPADQKTDFYLQYFARYLKERLSATWKATSARLTYDPTSEVLLERMEGGTFTRAHKAVLTSFFSRRGSQLIPDIEEGFYRVTLTVPGYRQCESSLTIERKGTAEVVFTPEPCMTIQGTVKGGDLAGIPGLTVIAEREGRSQTGGSVSGSAVTGQNGNFTLAGLHPGIYRVYVRSEFKYSSDALVEAGASDLTIVVRNQVMLVARLDQDDLPLPTGLDVAFVLGSRIRTGRCSPSKDGLISIDLFREFPDMRDALEAGLVLFGNDWPPEAKRMIRIDDGPVIDAGVFIRQPRRTLSGRVVDDSGRAVESAEVAAYFPEIGAHIGTTSTDKKGRFAFVNAPMMSGEIEVRGRGYLVDRCFAFDSKGDDRVEIRLATGGVIEGALVDDSGEEIPYELLKVHPSIESRIRPFDFIVTDYRGRFRTRAVTPGTCSIIRMDTGKFIRTIEVKQFENRIGIIRVPR